MKNYTRQRLGLCAALGLLAATSGVFAQTAVPANPTPKADDSVVTLDTFVVSGTRASLAKSREFKREAAIISDSIVAEDVAKFPDLNLAESLQRLPGVAINREAGEGRRVSLRGLGPDFTRVQLNGMEVLGNVDSPQDSRGQGSRDRAFDFNIFASDLFSRMDLYKSFDAAQNEGGLAGTIGLFTAKPFDKPGFNGAISTQLGSNTQTKDLQPRGAFLISNTWGKKFGALLSVAYSNRNTEEQGTNTYRWRPATSSTAYGSNISALSAADQALVKGGTVRFARGNRMSSWASDSERLGITSAFQWRPTEDIELTLDILHGKFKGKRTELHLDSRGANSSSWLGGAATVAGVVHPNSTINAIKIVNNEAVYLDVSNGNISTESRRQLADNTFDQGVLSGRWKITDRLKATFLLGTERSIYDMPYSDKFYTEAFGDVVSDYTRDRYYGYHTYKMDTANPENFSAHEIDFSSSYQETNFDNAKVDFDFFLRPGSSLKFGAAYQDFTNKGYADAYNDYLLPQFESGAVDDSVSSYAYVFRNHKDADWVAIDWDKAMSKLGITRQQGTRSGIYKVEEATSSGYARYDWETTLFGHSLTGNAGFRGYRTTVTSTGTANVGPITIVKKYNDVLPALNATFKLSDDLLLRAAASQNINRPTLGSMAVNGTVTNSNGEIKVNSGNPGLKPYYSDNYDLSLEWYFGDIGYAAVGVFRKDVSGFISNLVSTNVTYGSTGLPLDLYTGITAATNVAEYSRPVNFEDASITGVEFTVQSDLKFLPAPFNKLGVIANLTLVDGELDYASPAEQAAGTHYVSSISGLSDKLGNVTLYYETKKWGARVSANYRSGYVAYPLAIANDEFGDGFNATVYVDFSAFYQINDRMKLTFDAINLTDQREEQYSDLVARRHYNTTTAGTSFFAGVNYKF
ncbi:MAG: TonB-dependent receptor [Opitutae bacterium]|nr:TonB-dependent receptor [Opitutae bacterium]